jgi:hypothetical protein
MPALRALVLNFSHRLGRSWIPGLPRELCQLDRFAHRPGNCNSEPFQAVHEFKKIMRVAEFAGVSPFPASNASGIYGKFYGHWRRNRNAL